MAIKTILLGIGNIGAIYDINKKIGITHSSVLQKNKNFEIIAAIDKNSKKRKLFEKNYKVKSYKNFNKINGINSAKLLVVTFKIKINYLEKIVKNNKFKSILFEKPFDYNQSEVLKIKDLLIKKKIKFYINFQRNYSPLFKNMIKKIKKKDIGKNIKIFCFFSKKFIVNGIHFLALFLNLSKKINYFKKISNDLYFVKLEKIDIYFLNTNKKNFNYNAFEIFGSKGKISLSSRPEILTYYKLTNDKIFPKYKVLKKHEIQKSRIDVQKYIYDEIYLNLNNKNMFDKKFNEKYFNFLKKYR
jgi:hypothetical protein